MGIFSRLGTLIKSNLNELISKAEDPQKMLNQIVLDMQNQLVEAKKQVAVSIADEKRLKKQLDEQSELSKEWERKAMMAVRGGDDVLAKEALRRKQEHDTQIVEFAKQWDLQKQAVDKLKEQLRTLNDKIEEAKRKKNILIARQKARRGPEGHPGHDAWPVGHQRVRLVRSDVAAGGSDRGRGRGLDRAGQRAVGRHPGAEVQGARIDRHGRGCRPGRAEGEDGPGPGGGAAGAGRTDPAGGGRRGRVDGGPRRQRKQRRRKVVVGQVGAASFPCRGGTAADRTTDHATVPDTEIAVAGPRSVADRLLGLAEANATGLLTLCRGKVEKKLYLRDGVLVSAESNLREEALGEIFVALGMLGKSRLPALLTEVQAPGH